MQQTNPHVADLASAIDAAITSAGLTFSRCELLIERSTSSSAFGGPLRATVVIKAGAPKGRGVTHEEVQAAMTPLGLRLLHHYAEEHAPTQSQMLTISAVEA